MNLRRGDLGDLDAICAIETASFSDPWSRESFEAAFESPLCEFIIAKDEGETVGYALFSALYEDAEVMSLAVLPSKRRCGIGRALLRRIIERAKSDGAETLFLEVRESNAAAIALYESFGFEEIRRIRRYYRRPVEDAVVMALGLPGESADT